MFYITNIWKLSLPFFLYFFFFSSFLSQTINLLNEDESIYCISAWNDQVSNTNNDLDYIIYVPQHEIYNIAFFFFFLPHLGLFTLISNLLYPC